MEKRVSLQREMVIKENGITVLLLEIMKKHLILYYTVGNVP